MLQLKKKNKFFGLSNHFVDSKLSIFKTNFFRYLLDYQMTGNQIGVVVKMEGFSAQKNSKKYSRTLWLTRFRRNMERCLNSSRYEYQFKSSLYKGRRYNDYSFHNMVIFRIFQLIFIWSLLFRL